MTTSNLTNTKGNQDMTNSIESLRVLVEIHNNNAATARYEMREARAQRDHHLAELNRTQARIDSLRRTAEDAENLAGHSAELIEAQFAEEN